jgi:hypothetical protein
MLEIVAERRMPEETGIISKGCSVLMAEGETWRAIC